MCGLLHVEAESVETHEQKAGDAESGCCKGDQLSIPFVGILYTVLSSHTISLPELPPSPVRHLTSILSRTSSPYVLARMPFL